jgi:transposase
MERVIDDHLVQEWLGQGVSQNEIARRLDMPRSTVKRYIKKLKGVPNGKHEGVPQSVSGGTHRVNNDVDLAGLLAEYRDDLAELVAWWRERKGIHAATYDASQATQRQTYHVEKRYIEAIKRASDLEHVSITAIVNRAFGHYFAER